MREREGRLKAEADGVCRKHQPLRPTVRSVWCWFVIVRGGAWQCRGAREEAELTGRMVDGACPERLTTLML